MPEDLNLIQTIPTTRLALEPQVVDHAGEMFTVLSDLAIYEFENEPPESLDWLRERFSKLESRVSPDGSERWLNWVVRVRGEGLIGYVQATVLPDARAFVAYELGSAHWGRGYAQEAVGAMLMELAGRYGVRQAGAVFKQRNYRSRRLLERLNFLSPSPTDLESYCPAADEELLVLLLGAE